MRPIDCSGYVPDEDVASGPRAILDTATEALLQLAEMRGFTRAMSIVVEQNLKHLEELERRASCLTT